MPKRRRSALDEAECELVDTNVKDEKNGLRSMANTNPPWDF